LSVPILHESPALSARLVACGQDHLLGFWQELDPEARERLVGELESLNFDLIERLRGLASSTQASAASPTISAPETIGLDEVRAGSERVRAARIRGEEELAAGRVGLVLVAGGQASRLGCDGPKGDFPVGPVSGRTLFDLHARRILGLVQRYGVRMPWYVMTSPANHEETQAIFEANQWYGLRREDIHFFCQTMLPVLDSAGRVLMRDRGSLFLAPNGHGGVLEGLASSGCLADACERGIETLGYFQVDNPLVRPADALFIGLHCMAGAQMSSKVVRKSSPEEKVGVLGHLDGRLGCIEYSDMPNELLERRGVDGELVFSAGNIAVHALSVDFIAEITNGGLELPWHLAHKRIPSLDAAGDACERDGVKFETFVFDALGFAETSVTLEVERREEFAPVKNREGADSPDTARAMMCALHAGWAQAAGLELPKAGEDGVTPLEVDSLLADDLESFRAVHTHAPLVTDEGHLYYDPRGSAPGTDRLGS
jgi:UDP-N-acetylglucosamine/UDP-N-acetylgalactosamine diphosphorylase